MSMVVGQVAPDIALKTRQNGQTVTVKLSDYRDKNLVILFFPLAFTGVCTKEMCSVQDGFALYDSLNANVVGISVDSPFTLEVFAEKNKITFPLLSDFNKEAITAFGAKYELFSPGNLDFQGVAKRSAFVIDKQGAIQYAEVLDNAGDLPNFDNIKQTLETLQ